MNDNELMKNLKTFDGRLYVSMAALRAIADVSDTLAQEAERVGDSLTNMAASIQAESLRGIADQIEASYLEMLTEQE